MVDPASIRRVTASAAEDLARLHAAAFDRPWTAATLAGMINDGAVALLATGGDGKAAAMALARIVLDEAEILTIATAPRQRGQGLAGQVLAHLLADLAQGAVEQVWLEVAVDNAPALALYQRAGFEPCGRRPGYYSRADGAVDALLLRKRLNSETH